MNRKRKKYNPELMADVALEAIQKKSTVSEIARKYDVNPAMVYKWKNMLVEKCQILFDNQGQKYSQEQVDELYRKIIRLKVQLKDQDPE